MTTSPSPTALTAPRGALVIGASSGMGAAIAQRLAHEGYHVALVARRTDLLDAECARITAAVGPGRAQAYPHDVTHYDEVPELFQRILRDLTRLDMIVYASGAMETITLDEFTFAKDRVMIEVNVLGAIAWLNQAAVLFARQHSGHIVGISSVAGERGRVGNPVYTASKAAFTTYLEALRNRLTRQGVHVLTVKPGFVATAMLKNAARAFWVIPPEQAAADIVRATHAGRQELYTPARWALVMTIIRAIPSIIFRRLSF